MKKIFVAAAIIVVLGFSVNFTLADHIVIPTFPADNMFQKLGPQQALVCGVFQEFYYYDINAGTVWTKIYFNGDKQPLFWVKSSRGSDIWVDNDRDGHVDEHFFSESDFRKKYPTSCDAVK